MAQQEASIVFKAYDEITDSMRSMEDQSEALNKEWELQQRQLRQLGDRYKEFNRRSAESKTQAMETKKAMDEARKAFRQTGDEAERTRFTQLQQEYRELTDAARAYQDAAADTRRSMRETADTARRTGMDGSGGGGGGGLAGMMSQLGQAGAFGAVGQIAGQWAGTMAGSLLGNEGGTLFGGALSGAGTGAAIGSMIAPGIGTAVGAVLGGVGGLIGAGSQVYEQRDDAFKDYYGNLYRTVNQETLDSIVQGKSLAAMRETDRLAFATALGGDAEAEEFLGKLVDTANATPFVYDDLTRISQTLLSFGKAADEVIPTLLKVGDAGAAKGLGAGEIAEVATYLGRMSSFDKATREFLDPLASRGFAVYDWLAEALGLSKTDTMAKISKGEVSGTWAEDVILSAFGREFGGMMERQSQTTAGLDSTLQGLTENISAAGGDAYNALRNEGKTRSIDFYGEAFGEELAAIEAIAGENQAALENQADELKERALMNLISGIRSTDFNEDQTAQLSAMHDEYIKAKQIYDTSEKGSDEYKEAGLKIESLKEETIALATATHESSDLYKLKLDAEDEQLTAIRSNTDALEASTLAYNQMQGFTKGQGFMGLGAPGSGPFGPAPVGMASYSRLVTPHASGLQRVPYDGYAALLHQGERVLTASEAREADRGGASITINVSGLTVREEADIERIATRLADEIEARQMAMGE